MSNNTNGLEGSFAQAIMALIAASGGRIWINSGFRSVERQAQLYNDKVNELRNQGVPNPEEAARKWVAPPGRSNHGRGLAVDLGGDLELAHQLASRFGLRFPMDWEPWHIEPLGARAGQDPNFGSTDPPDGWTGPTDGNMFQQMGTQMFVLTQLLQGKTAAEVTAMLGMGTTDDVSGDDQTQVGYGAEETAGWAQDFLNALDIPANEHNLAFVNAWMRAESGGGGGKFNPLNTTQGGFAGETNYNDVGVKNYSNYADGITANVHAIQNGRYENILAAMRSGSAYAMAQALEDSPWGTGALTKQILEDEGFGPERTFTPMTPTEKKTRFGRKVVRI